MTDKKTDDTATDEPRNTGQHDSLPAVNTPEGSEPEPVEQEPDGS